MKIVSTYLRAEHESNMATSHCLTTDLIVAVVVGVVEPVEELGGLNATEAAFVVKEVAELTKISLNRSAISYLMGHSNCSNSRRISRPAVACFPAGETCRSCG